MPFTMLASALPAATLAQGAAISVDLTLSDAQLAIVDEMLAQAAGSQTASAAIQNDTAMAGVTATANTAIAAAIASLGSTALRDYIAGLTTSYNGATSFAVAVGTAISDNQSAAMALATPLIKTTGIWTVGNSLGGLDTGTIAANHWYHIFLIQRTDTGNVDVLFSSSPTTPTMPTSYTLKRRIGSLRTNASSQFIKWFQYGETFIWDAPVQDRNGSFGVTTAVLITMTVPTGVQVEHFGTINLGTSNPTNNLIDDPDTTDVAATNSISTVSPNATIIVAVRTRTNTSGQIRFRTSLANNPLIIQTLGWRDRRGRDA